VEVVVWQEDSGVLARMGSKGEDTCYGSEGGGKSTVVAHMEPAFDAHPIREDKISHDKVFGVGVKASTGLDSTTCTKSELVASTLKR